MFGLIIEPKRLVNFEKVDQPAAHEIFLRDALTTGNLGTVPPFLKHNLLKLEEVERVEDKLRRRDLVVDEETIYQFYASKIPEEIASRRSFEDWRATVEAKIRVIYTWKMMRFGSMTVRPRSNSLIIYIMVSYAWQLLIALTQVMMKMAQRSKFRYRHCLR